MNSLKGEYRLKKRNIKKILGIGSLCLFLLGCSEESFLVQKDSSTIILEDEIILAEKEQEELHILQKDNNGQSEENLIQSSEGDMSKNNQQQGSDGNGAVITEEQEPAGEIVVHICGAVNQPGVYYLKENQRLYEGIQKAGGFREDADADYLNQALLLEDGMKIVIPTKEEVSLEENKKNEIQKLKDTEMGNNTGIGNISDNYIFSEKTTAELAMEGGWLQKKDMQHTEEELKVSENQNGKVNLNTADEALLCTLPGIGESRAKSIITYRQEHGPFQKPEDIMKVSGIKQAAYEKIKDYVIVSE